MTEPVHSYTAEAQGFWRTQHVLTDAEGKKGVLTAERNGLGMVVRGRWVPEKGEVLVMRRDPGLLRSQFSIWTDGREWLGSSLRWSFSQRGVTLSTGNKPYRLLPLPGWQKGWRLIAPRTGEVARFHGGLLSRKRTLDVYRRIDFELVLFAYFLGSLIQPESIPPGPLLDVERVRGAATSGA